jgi:D-alanyl-D-alanine carboxypeptidase
VWATVVVACLLVGGVAALAFHAWAGGPDGAGAPPPTTSSSAPATAPTSAGPTPAASPSPTPSLTPTPTPEPTAVGIDLAAHSTTEPDSIWVVVNKQHPIAPLTYEPADLVNVGGTTIRAVAADDLQAMLAAAKADGVVMGLRTAYRSYGSQAAIRADVERRRGFAHAEKYSARPGYSEHQTGLSLDLHGTSRPGCDLSTCFADTAEGQWVAAHAAEYGDRKSVV